VLAATLLVFLSLAAVVAMSHLTASGRGALADRLCAGARILLPLALLVVGVATIVPGLR
jgi:hypothetical protein